MKLAERILIILIALEHLCFLVLEMFLFTTPTGLHTFGTTQEFANAAATLAANQGLYNGFLVAGLLWGAAAKSPVVALHFKTFFLLCVFLAGSYGAWTLGKSSIFFLQGLPALIALVLVQASSRRDQDPEGIVNR